MLSVVGSLMFSVRKKEGLHLFKKCFSDISTGKCCCCVAVGEDQTSEEDEE